MAGIERVSGESAATGASVAVLKKDLKQKEQVASDVMKTVEQNPPPAPSREAFQTGKKLDTVA